MLYADSGGACEERVGMHGTGQTFAEVLRDAIRDRGLPLDRLQQRLAASGTPVSIATLSYWQTGRSIPFRSASLAALIELERALELAPGHLSRLLEDARSARSLQKLEGRARTLPLSGLATNLAQSLGLSFASTLRNVSVHCRLFVSSERIEVREEVRLVLTAHRADNQAYPVVQRQLTESRITPRVVAGTGFTLGRTVAVPERQLLLAELLPMRQLEPGENLMAEYTVHWAPVQVPTTAHERSSTRGFRELVLQVDFDPAAVPRTVSYRSRANNDEPVPDTGITVPIVDGVAQFVRLNVPPGVHGLYWSWD